MELSKKRFLIRYQPHRVLHQTQVHAPDVASGREQDLQPVDANRGPSWASGNAATERPFLLGSLGGSSNNNISRSSESSCNIHVAESHRHSVRFSLTNLSAAELHETPPSIAPASSDTISNGEKVSFTRF